MLLTYLLNYAIIISQQRKTQKTKAGTAKPASNHGTGTQLKNRKDAIYYSKGKTK